MSDQQIKDVAERVLRQDISRPGLRGAEAVFDVSLSGDPIIRVTARYKTMPRPPRPLDGMHAIRTELLRLGEERIVFLTNKYEDELTSVEDDAS